MSGYGMYGFKQYISKKGKDWYYNNTGSKYGAENAHFDFTRNKTNLLEEIEEDGKIKIGLQPYALIPKESRWSTETKLYFAIEDDSILLESLINLMNIPFIHQDRIVFNNVNPKITGYDCYNMPMYNNIPMDVKEAIMNRDSLTRKYLSNKIIAFCFEYVFPYAAYDMSIYNNSINDILTSKGFKDRIMIIRTDITNNRILFIVSNITENTYALDRYMENYETSGKEKKYKGSEILFTKRADTMYNTLDNKLYNTLQEYKEGVQIFIKKNK